MRPTARASAPAPPARRVEWRRAWRALRALVHDPERTEQVFELIDALSGSSGERLFQRFRRDPEGQRLLRERPSLLAALEDLAALEALPEASLGHGYARFMRSERIDAHGLVEASEPRNADGPQIDAEREFFYERLRDMHDLWHVLTGYGRDIAGEVANLAFTYAQTRTRGVAVIVIAAALLGPKTLDCFWQRYLWSAYRRGRRAGALPMACYEELLPLPLDAVRRRLGIEPAELAHPGGILAFQPEGAGSA